MGAEDYITKAVRHTGSDHHHSLTHVGRAQAIHEANEAEFDALKQQMVNVFSHELRHPPYLYLGLY
jgi:hypothetical protein